MSEEPNIRRTTAPRRSTRYEVTRLETGSLASRSSAAFIRRRRHIQQEIQDTLQKLELHSKVMELRRALREEENNAIALSSCSPRQPSSTASNSKQPQPRQQQQQPASASRTLDSASVHSNILPDSDTPVLKHNESTSTELTTQQRYVSPPPTQVIHLSSENQVQHPSTCTDQSEKFLDLGTRTWRGADVWVQLFLHAVSRNFDLVIHLAQCGLDNQSAGLARRICFLLRHLSKFPSFKKENPSCRFWDMALGSFAAAFEKISLPPYTRVRWRGMVRCGAFATKARNSTVVETSFADALVREFTNRVWRNSLRAHRFCLVVAWLYPDLGISRTADSETTNRGYYAVDQASSYTKAATVKQHTAHATSSTKSTSSPSKPLSCEHTEQWPTNPMTVLLYAHAQPNLPSTNSSSVTNHRAQPVASPTPISTTSVTMTTPSEAQAPSPFYNSRPTRSSSSQATTQLTHGLPAQNSTTMDRNNNAVCDTLQATGHKPRPRLIFDTRDWQLFTFTFSLSLSPVSSPLPPKVRFFRVGSVAETRHLSEPY